MPELLLAVALADVLAEVLSVLLLAEEALLRLCIRFCSSELNLPGPPPMPPMGGGGGGALLASALLTLLLVAPVSVLLAALVVAAVVLALSAAAVVPLVLVVFWAFRAAIRLCRNAAMALWAALSVLPVLLLVEPDASHVLPLAEPVAVVAVVALVVSVALVPSVLLVPRFRPRLDNAWAMPCSRGPPPGGGPGGGPSVDCVELVEVLESVEPDALLPCVSARNQLLLLPILLMDMGFSFR